MIINNFKMEKKHILQEFEWFEVQTKVRQIINEVILPLQKRLVSNTSSISKIQQFNKVETQKIETLIRMVDNDPHIFQTGIFANVEQKFQNQHRIIHELELKIQKQNSYVNNKFQLLDSRLAEASDSIKSATEFKQYTQNEMEKQQEYIVNATTNISENFDAINKEIQLIEIQLKSINEIQDSLTKDCFDLSKSFIDIKALITDKLDRFTNQNKELTLESEKNTIRIEEMRVEVKRIQQFEKLNQKLKRCFQDVQNQINKLEFKIQVNAPIVSVSMLNQFLYQVLPEKFHKNIAIYYNAKYRELIENVLNKKFTSQQIQEEKLQNIKVIKEVHERVLKMIFKIKKDIIMEQGIDFDHLSHEKREEYLNGVMLIPEIRSENFDDEVKHKNNLTEEVILNLVNQTVHQLIKDLASRNQEAAKNHRKYAFQMQEQLRKQMMVIETIIQKHYQEYSENNVNSCLNFKGFEENIKQNNKKIMHLHQQIMSKEGFFQLLYQLINNQISINSQSNQKSVSLLQKIQQILKKQKISTDTPKIITNKRYQSSDKQFEKTFQSTTQKSKFLPLNEECILSTNKIINKRSEEYFRKWNSQTNQEEQNLNIQSSCFLQTPRIIKEKQLNPEELLKKTTSLLWNRQQEKITRASHRKRIGERLIDNKQELLSNSSIIFQDLKRKNKQFLK